MTTTCGHTCCRITDNPYHAHVDDPEDCARCNELAQARPVSLGTIVADVLARVAPQIPGLPTGTELAERVGNETLAVYRAADHDATLAVLTPDELRAALAGRVGIALAFPTDDPP